MLTFSQKSGTAGYEDASAAEKILDFIFWILRRYVFGIDLVPKILQLHFFQIANFGRRHHFLTQYCYITGYHWYNQINNFTVCPLCVLSTWCSSSITAPVGLYLFDWNQFDVKSLYQWPRPRTLAHSVVVCECSSCSCIYRLTWPTLTRLKQQYAGGKNSNCAADRTPYAKLVYLVMVHYVKMTLTELTLIVKSHTWFALIVYAVCHRFIILYTSIFFHTIQ